jgi:hypothetical protein
MTKKERVDNLSKIIEMRPPSWLTKDVYQDYQEKRQTLKNQFKGTSSLLQTFSELTFEDIQSGKVSVHPRWKSYSFQYSPKILVDKWNSDCIISDPTSGQDPKKYSNQNLKVASFHAGRQWGYTDNIVDGEFLPSNSEWIQYGTFNLITYPNGKVILEPCNVEHRIWGLIGFALDLVPIDATKPIYFYHSDLEPLYDSKTNTMVKRMQVNGMYLSDIVHNASKKGCVVSQDEILNTHFYSNKFNFQILPFFSKEETETFFKEVNTSSAKKITQLFHANSEPIMNWAKSFSSPKCVGFTPLGAKYHPLFELMSDTELVKLEGLMYSFEVINFIDNNEKAISTTDAKLVENYEKTNGYANSFSSIDFQTKVIETLDFLYSLISKSENPKLSRQFIQQLLLIKMYLNENDFVIADKYLFIEAFCTFYNNEQDNNGNLTPFGRNVRAGSEADAKDAFKHVKLFFIKSLSLDNLDYLKQIGIVVKSSSLSRVFSKDVIFDNLELHHNKDIDDSILLSEPVGGHIISDMELIRMTSSERDEAFKLEKLGDKFDFNKNCRAMSSYHNLRMGILRLSEYMSVISLDDSTLNKIKRDRYNELKKKPILV